MKHAGYNVASLDITSNTAAAHNVIVSPDFKLKDQVNTLIKQTQDFSYKYDAIICVAGGFEAGSIKDSDLFDKYERQDRLNFQSALLAAHIATKSLTPSGLLMFTGAAAVFEGPVNFAYAYYVAKSATHALALQMSERTEIPVTSSVITILP